MIQIMIFLFLICHERVSFANYVYDEEAGKILVGGYTVEDPRREITGKIKNLEKKLHWVTIDGKSRLFFQADSSIERYEMSNAGYVAVNREGYVLDIVSPYGVVLRSFNGVMTGSDDKVYSWSPDGRKVAYIKADKTEGVVPYLPKGVYIYDIEKNEVEKIYEYAVEINWSTHDGNIYMIDSFGTATKSKCLIYNVLNKTISISTIDSIYYSDSGNYCIINKSDPDGSDNYIYDIKKSRYIQRYSENNEEIYSINYIYGFIPKNDVVWVSNWSPSYKLINPMQGKKIYSKPKTSLLGWNKEGNKGVIYKGGEKITVLNLLTGKELFDVDLPEE